MNYNKKILFVLIIAFCSFSGVLHAQESYTIQGRIIDASTKEPLPGASVFDSLSNYGVSTDIDGYFRMTNIKAGSLRVTVTYLGYESKSETFQFPKDQRADISIELKPAGKALENVTVISSFEGQQRALNQQRTADNIRNIISADLIGKFPDQNVAEALQRVPGINISRDKGEGSSVTIRGTPAHFTNISINGEQLISVQQSGGRAEALDLIPADQLGSMEITKALTAEMDGDAIGGNINLRTPTARSLKLQVRGDVGGGFNDISGKLNNIGRLRLSKRFFANDNNKQGRLGVMLSGSYYATNNSEDRMDATWRTLAVPVGNEGMIVPQDFQFRKTENKRTRIGATGTIDYKVRNHEIVFNYMFNSREDDDIRNRLRFDFDRPNVSWAAIDSINRARTRRDINLWRELKTNHNFNLEGFHTLGSWMADWGAFYSTSKRDFTSTRGDFSFDDVTIVADNAGGALSEVPRFRTGAGYLGIKNPLLYNDFRRYEEDMETTDASNKVAKFNISKDYFLGSNKSTFKFGGKARQITNSKFRDNRVFAFFDPNEVNNLQEAFANVIGSTEPVEFLNGRFDYGPRVNEGRFTDYIARNRRLLIQGDDSWDAERISKNSTYDASEDVYAAYALNRVHIKKLMILAGVRYEYNKVKYDAFDVKRSGTAVIATPVTGGTDYGFLLPSLHLKYGLSSLTNMRFAYTQSYAKPNFVDLVPFINYDADAMTLFLGNTELMPSLSNNLDLMYEQYNRQGGIISLGLFYKNMNRFQFTRIVPALPEDFPGFPQTAGFEFRQEQNGRRATVYGLEVNIMQQLKNLPGLLSGLSAYLNYTFTGSDASTQDRTGIRLPGQAMHTGNASVSFDYKGFTGKVNLNYNGSFINSVASSAADDIMQDERLQLDLNFTQSITKKIGVYAEFMNITNSPARQYQGEKDKVSRLAYFGWWSRFGLNFRF
ncbi:MAG: TonB-dependent receptor [Niabella sp.]